MTTPNASPPVHIDLTDFGNTMPKENTLVRWLRERYTVVLADDPDFLIYSHNTNVHRLYTCKKIFWTSEAGRPNWRECDYALTHHYMDDSRHLRLPLYAIWVRGEELVRRADEAATLLPAKTRFCCFVSSYLNAKTEHRGRFFHLLSRHRQVDAAGKALNNLGHQVPFQGRAKIDFLRPYKFYMAFENESLPGYTTEKIAEAMLARCVPIYWGNPRVVEEFNPRSFINANDFPSLEALAQHVAEVDRNDALYREYFCQPYFHENRPNEYFDKGRFLDFFGRIFADPTPPLAARQRRWWGRWVLTKRNPPHRPRTLGPVPVATAGSEPKPGPAA